ncbi:hypothetical protein [Photobacterium kishitanii]|uniref:Uncharacterized protein n=1 Tax=Photobacterium kishitanii TaxID=318456 RepID=A0A2T3KL80_9GAMM|nr:hypothetical protein [Photobacterium kishitanii]PSV00475.1 hypothetical protein C9J27_04905 [Photobacterium kishitanii]
MYQSKFPIEAKLKALCAASIIERELCRVLRMFKFKGFAVVKREDSSVIVSNELDKDQIDLQAKFVLTIENGSFVTRAECFYNGIKISKNESKYSSDVISSRENISESFSSFPEYKSTPKVFIASNSRFWAVNPAARANRTLRFGLKATTKLGDFELIDTGTVIGEVGIITALKIDNNVFEF